ncbi:AAA family ATPase [Yaniella halotolerans]|uniref:AAA family ATPase n=1 Tax=Yaniella halotolerans TaxID=225453 RepID=UPI0003B34BA4|nr:AAA family ATPase [Yaniella halotolerans]
MDRSGSDRVVDRWREHSLLGDASLLYPDDFPHAWAYENVQDLYVRFVENPIEGEGRFDAKWEEQLSGASQDVRLVAAEILAVYYLFTNTVGYNRKLEMVNATIGDAGPDVTDEDVQHAFRNWIGAPGMGYNTSQYLPVRYLIDFAKRIKRLATTERRELLEDNPWGFMDFADDTEQKPHVMRNILCHLVYPEYFERIAATGNKQDVHTAFAGLYDAAEDENLDQRLYGIRKVLEQSVPGEEEQLDFFSDELESIWRTAPREDTKVSPLSALLRKKQIVFHGPPGTGKTFTANELAESLIRSSAIQRWGVEDYYANRQRIEQLLETHVTRLQLHPGFGYSEFIAGLQLGEGNRTEYQEGKLLQIIRQMHDMDSGELAPLPHVLLLDEINRTDLSAMLGEAFSAIEADKRGTPVTLPATDQEGNNFTLVIPEDLYIIGTMNEIDHSVESLDFALRRRFLWFNASFDAEGLRAIWQDEWERVRPRVSHDDAEPQLEHLIDNIETLNAEIASTPDLGRAYQVGHAFFSELAFLVDEAFPGRRPDLNGILWTRAGNPTRALISMWEFSIRPLLEQYLAGSDIQDDLLTGFEKTFMAPPGAPHA